MCQCQRVILFLVRATNLVKFWNIKKTCPEGKKRNSESQTPMLTWGPFLLSMMQCLRDNSC